MISPWSVPMFSWWNPCETSPSHVKISLNLHFSGPFWGPLLGPFLGAPWPSGSTRTSTRAPAWTASPGSRCWETTTGADARWTPPGTNRLPTPGSVTGATFGAGRLRGWWFSCQLWTFGMIWWYLMTWMDLKDQPWEILLMGFLRGFTGIWTIKHDDFW